MNYSKVENPGVKLLEEKRQHLKTLYPLDQRNPWKQEHCDGHVLLHSQLDPKTGLKIIRSQIKIAAPKEKVMEFANDVNAILEWDKTIDGVKTICSTQDYLIVYALAKKVTMSKQRESLMISKCYTEDDGRVFGVACSIEHPNVPHCDKKVRITAYLVGWVLESDPTNPNVTNFIKVLHINPEGHVPSSIFNKFTHAQGLNVKAFGDYAERKWQQDKVRTQCPQVTTQSPQVTQCPQVTQSHQVTQGHQVFQGHQGHQVTQGYQGHQVTQGHQVFQVPQGHQVPQGYQGYQGQGRIVYCGR